MAISRRTLLFSAAPALIGLPAKSAPKQPNVLFVLTDDQRWDSLGLMGHPCLKTPNLDRLGREGARFAHAFVTTSLCSPSRASFLTGQYARRHGVRDNLTPLPAGTETFATLLQKAGYETAHIGKWHMDGMKERPGFSHTVTFDGQGTYADPLLRIDGRQRKVPGYLTDLLTDYAVEWLEKERAAPFCMYFGHKACHLPVIPAPRHRNACSGVVLPVPESATDTLEGKPEWVKQRARGRTGVLNNPRYDENHRNYLRTLLAVDESVGRLLETLERRRMLDSTVVVFASDNGFFHREHGLTNKRAMYEESIRIPLLVRYPALVRPGTVPRGMALNIDLAPTLLELARLPVPRRMQGRSLVPLLTAKARRIRESFFYEYYREESFPDTPSMQGIRTERWKYIRYPDIANVEELYDLESDPREMRNLAPDTASAGALGRLRREFRRLSASL